MLWVALKALEPLCKSSPGLRVVVYTGDTDASPAQILEKAKVRICVKCEHDVHVLMGACSQQRFQIDLTSSPLSVQFAYVRRRHLMNANR